MRKFAALGLAAGLALLPSLALAQEGAVDAVDTGDTAWILTSSALVLLMTLPGLTLFYGGLVRAKNFLSVLVQVGAVAAIASMLWILVGYTLAFGPVSNGWLGGFGNLMLNNLGNVRADTLVPESGFALFQMMFAAITPALMVGAWVDRARFGWVVAFSALWGLLVYAPVAHWIWGGGWLSSSSRHSRFRRRNRGPHHGGRLGAGRRDPAGQAPGLPQDTDAAAQPVADHGRRGNAVGRLVRVQRRLGADRQR